MPTYEVMIEMVVPAQQTMKVDARNSTDALKLVRDQLTATTLTVLEDKQNWSIRKSRVTKLSSVIVKIADE